MRLIACASCLLVGFGAPAAAEDDLSERDDLVYLPAVDLYYEPATCPAGQLTNLPAADCYFPCDEPGTICPGPCSGSNCSSRIAKSSNAPRTSGWALSTVFNPMTMPRQPRHCSRRRVEIQQLSRESHRGQTKPRGHRTFRSA